MMTQQDGFGYGEFEELQVLELPYAGHDLSVIVLLPRRRDGLPQLEAALSVESLRRWTTDLEMGEVQVFLPRFKVTFAWRLEGALHSLGMTDAFSEEADFSGMDGSRLLYIGAVLHKAFVNLNEEGVEAAAATATATLAGGPPPAAPVFRADHPFLFLIRDNRMGSILFLGRVVNPTAE
jgi:serpin B